MGAAEVIDSFECFGSRCGVIVTGAAPERSAREAAEHAKNRLLAWHLRFSRFLEESELSLVNGDARRSLTVSFTMARLAHAVRFAGSTSGGLVDGTLLVQIKTAGYHADLPSPLSLADTLRMAPPRRPARPASERPWIKLHVDLAARMVTRPPGLQLDSGGLAKGLFADLLAAQLARHPRFAVDCAGDLIVGGTAEVPRAIDVESPFDGRTLHTFELARTGVATSGIGRRAWLDAAGRPAHHLLDPSSGRPAFTGIVQATALAPSALLAEVRAKAALLSGPLAARRWLPDGGLIVFDDGSHEVIEPPPTVTLNVLTTRGERAARPRALAG